MYLDQSSFYVKLTVKYQGDAANDSMNVKNVWIPCNARDSSLESNAMSWIWGKLEYGAIYAFHAKERMNL